MTRKTFVAKTLIAAAALTALGASAALPASAHTSNMYGYIEEGVGLGGQTFATWSKTDGTVTRLAEEVFGTAMQGIEVYGEKGTAVGFTEAGVTGWEWDHSTGAISAPIPLFVAGADLESISGLDTQLDGTSLTLVQYFVVPEEGDIQEFYAVAKVNFATGEVTPVVNISDLLIDNPGDYSAVSIATDPLGAGTFVFLQNGALESLFVSVDVVAGTHGDPTLFQGLGFDVNGQIWGADFDGDGTLFFVFENYSEERYELSKTTGVSTWVTAARTFISEAPANASDYDIAERALTIEWTTLAATGSELPIAAIVIVGTVAVLAGGVTVIVARRRSEAGVL